ncbi:hypothetical protein J6590_086023, partial [Homalodisca vitripennis]
MGYLASSFWSLAQPCTLSISVQSSSRLASYPYGPCGCTVQEPLGLPRHSDTLRGLFRAPPGYFGYSPINNWTAEVKRAHNRRGQTVGRFVQLHSVIPISNFFQHQFSILKQLMIRKGGLIRHKPAAYPISHTLRHHGHIYHLRTRPRAKHRVGAAPRLIVRVGVASNHQFRSTPPNMVHQGSQLSGGRRVHIIIRE